jgi:hypothetical protein
MAVKKETFEEKYMEFELMNGRAPHSAFELCKSMKKKEEDFFEAFSSLEQLRKSILGSIMTTTMDILDKDDNYAEYSGREQTLALFYTLFEQFKKKRSYLMLKYSNAGEVMHTAKDWDVFFRQFEARMEHILMDARQTEEVQSRPYIADHYAKGFKLAFTYVFRVWLKDVSEGFETTDAAIEKTVNLAYDMLGVSPLDSLLDFGRFAIKTKIV